jgi:hypothetical protein
MKTQEYNTHSFHIIKNDIFDITNQLLKSKHNTTIVIPHVCNNVNAFGAGFADALSNRYPVVKANFHVNGSQQLSKTQFVIANSINRNRLVVANMIAQNGIINSKNKRPLHYPSLVKCMYSVKQYINNISSDQEFDAEIHAPKFGSGLAGGNWNFIADLIDDIWSNIDTYIYIQK